MAASGNKSRANGIIIVAGVVIAVFILYNIFKEKPAGTSSTGTVEAVAEDSAYDSSGYRLVFSEKFNRAVASQDDLGVSILISVDCSGSMSDAPADSADSKPKYILASESLTGVLTFLEGFYNTRIKNQGIKLKVGLMRFSDDVRVLFEPIEMNEQYFEDLKRIASRPDVFSPGGKTAIGETIKAGVEILAQSGTIFKSLIIITDGENTTGEIPETVLQAVVDNRNNKSTRDFPVITSGILVSFIGFDLESETFASLAKIGSRVTSAANKAALDESLKNLFLADITRLESK